MFLCVIILSVILSGIGSAEKCTSSVVPPDPKSGCCGRANGNSLKKSTSIPEIDEYPWMALVEYKEKDKIKLLCSAILISGRYALSAAVCFSKQALDSGNPVNLRIGEYETKNDGKDCVEVKPGQEVCNDGAISVPIQKATSHSGFSTDSQRDSNDDIALIRLARTVPYTDFIRPICLPSLDITLQPPKNLYMTVAGWGAVNKTVYRSNVLRRVHVPFVDLQVCVGKYNKYTEMKINLTNRQLCAGSKGRDACKGDSGGPLMYFNRHTTELAGIVSFGPSPCGQDIPGVYTKVFAYKDWIHSVIEEDSRMFSTTTTSPDSDTDRIYFRE